MFDFVKEMIIFREKSSYENILMELGNVRKIVCREACYFKNPMIDEESKKKRLNLLFVKDLLDGVNGMILDHKDRRDNEIKSQVELWKKVLGWIFLLIVSMGMLFYIYLFAMRQSSNRQRAWFNSFQVWLFFEIFVISTGLVLVEHVLIPLWSMKEVQKVKEKIVSDILIFERRLRYCKERNGNNQNKDKSENKGRGLIGIREVEYVNYDEDEKEDKENNKEDKDKENKEEEFNAAKFLYPSYRIAELFPEYSESQLILQYKTPWPKKSLKRKEKSTKKRYDKRFEFIPKTIARIGIFVLTSVIRLPPSFQDMGIQMALFTFVGYVVKFHLRLYEINPILSCFPGLLLMILVYVLFLTGRKVRSMRNLKTYVLKDDNDKEKEKEEDRKDKKKKKENGKGNNKLNIKEEKQEHNNNNNNEEEFQITPIIDVLKENEYDEIQFNQNENNNKKVTGDWEDDEDEKESNLIFDYFKENNQISDDIWNSNSSDSSLSFNFPGDKDDEIVSFISVNFQNQSHENDSNSKSSSSSSKSSHSISSNESEDSDSNEDDLNSINNFEVNIKIKINK